MRTRECQPPQNNGADGDCTSGEIDEDTLPCTVPECIQGSIPIQKYQISKFYLKIQ